MTTKRVARLLAATLATAACATPYQARGFRGGFSEVEIDPGIYYLAFEANTYVSPATIVAYWHRRAGELCGGPKRYKPLTQEEVARQQFNSLVAMTRWRIAGLDGYIRCL